MKPSATRNWNRWMRGKNNSVSYDELSAISENLAKPVEPSILLLPSMRALSSYLKEDNQVTDPDGFWHWVQSRRITTGGAWQP